MVMQDKRSRIDARWQTLQPGWGKDHSSELRPLYEVLQDDEEIEALVSCTWGPGSVFREDAGRMDRMRRNKGVALVTRERVVMLKGASFGPHLVTEMPLETITSVDYDGAGDGLTMVGLSLSNWLGNDDARGINKITEGPRRPGSSVRRKGAGHEGQPSSTPGVQFRGTIRLNERGTRFRSEGGSPIRRNGQNGANRRPVAGTVDHVGPKRAQPARAHRSRADEQPFRRED